MRYTVNTLAKLSGVSISMLRYYDEINLLKPAYRDNNGYRYYEREQLLMLQQILFYRELGFSLKNIQKIIGSTNFDRIEALKSHKHILMQNIKRTQELINTINTTISYLKGEATMQNEGLYYGFNDKKQTEYEEYLVNEHGDTAKTLIAEGKERTKSWQQQDWDNMKQQHDVLNKTLIQAMQQGLAPDSVEVQNLVQQHYKIIDQFYTPTKEVYIGLGKMYCDNNDFRNFYDAYHPNLAKFLAQAMEIFANKQLS